MSAETALIGMMDHIAKGLEGSHAAWLGGTNLRARVDASADTVFEDRLVGADFTAMVNALADASLFSIPAIGKAMSDISNYILRDLDMATPTMASYLAAKGWRVPYWFAEAWYKAKKQRIPWQYVFPKGLRVASLTTPVAKGMHLFGGHAGTTYTVGDGALPSTVKAAPVLAVSMSAGVTGTLVALCTQQDGVATKQVAFTQNAGEFGSVILGQQAVGAAGAAAGQKVIPVAATAQFTALEWVLILRGDYSVAEVAQIATGGVSANTSLTVVSNLINSYASGTNDIVLPMFANVNKQSGTAGGSGVNFYAFPDRIIAL